MVLWGLLRGIVRVQTIGHVPIDRVLGILIITRVQD